MTKQHAAPLLLLVGLVVLAISFLWPVVSPSKNEWSEEKSIRKQELTKTLHSLAHVHANPGGQNESGGGERGDLEKKRAAAEAERRKLHAELEAVRNRPHQVATILKWAGITLVIAGLAVTLSQRAKDS